jgi:hypothetical protein
MEQFHYVIQPLSIEHKAVFSAATRTIAWNASRERYANNHPPQHASSIDRSGTEVHCRTDWIAAKMAGSQWQDQQRAFPEIAASSLLVEVWALSRWNARQKQNPN